MLPAKAVTRAPMGVWCSENGSEGGTVTKSQTLPHTSTCGCAEEWSFASSVSTGCDRKERHRSLFFQLFFSDLFVEKRRDKEVGGVVLEARTHFGFLTAEFDLPFIGSPATH